MNKIIEETLRKERKRQEENIELIASENYVSNDILKLQGSILTNKYAEGYPGKRYYGGCENVDVVEEESGIAKIEYTAKEGTNVTTSGEIKEKSYRFNNLKTQTKYEVTVTVTDNADNTSSLTREVTIL